MSDPEKQIKDIIIRARLNGVPLFKAEKLAEDLLTLIRRRERLDADIEAMMEQVRNKQK